MDIQKPYRENIRKTLYQIEGHNGNQGDDQDVLQSAGLFGPEDIQGTEGYGEYDGHGSDRHFKKD